MKIMRNYRRKAAAVLFFSLGYFLFPAAVRAAQDGFHLWGWNDGVTLQQATSPHALNCQQVVPADDGGAFAVYLYAEDLTPTYRYYDAQIGQRRDHIVAPCRGCHCGLQFRRGLPPQGGAQVAITHDGAGGAIVAWTEGVVR
jgi:hypothetical protein